MTDSPTTTGARLRVCLVYDCVFPYSVGGAERWYRNLAEALVAAGHDVTYLTLRQWGEAPLPDLAGVSVVGIARALPLYGRHGRRRMLPPLRFGVGVLAHLMRNGRRYDIVHTAAFPYFSVLASASGRARHRYALVVDWLECWRPSTWRDHAGPRTGRLGWLVQRACLRVRQHAVCFAALTEGRLREQGVNGPIVLLRGGYTLPADGGRPRTPEQLVLFVGRLVAEKNPASVVAAVAAARAQLPSLRGLILGDGPERRAVAAAISAHGLEDVVDLPGVVEEDVLHDALGRSLCLVLPSRREGFGLVVLEAAAHGTPAITVVGADNAAAELVEEGVNGMVAASAASADLAAAIVRVAEGGDALRGSTAEWFERNRLRLSLATTLEPLLAVYRRAVAAERARS